MKRQAEKQMIKGDDEVEDDDSPSEGFKKADDSVLAGRVIRGLPKRAGARAPPDAPSNTATITTSTTTPSLFSTSTSTFTTSTTAGTTPPLAAPLFSGFGFAKSSTTSTTDNSLSTSNPFGLSSSSFTAPSSSPKSSFNLTSSTGLPTMSSTATNTSKAFAASLSSSANPFGVTPAAAPSPSTFTAPASGDTSNDSVALKYYTDLRGLNISILSAISKTVEDDPFFDMSILLEKYKSFRTKIQEDFDKTTTKSGPKPEAISTSSSTSSTKSAMPAPPASFSGFDAFKPSSSSAPSTGPSKSNPFDFKSSSIGFGASTAPNPFAQKDSRPSNTPFGTSSFVPPSTSSTSLPSASSTPLTFGSPPKPAASQTTNPFGTFGATPSSSFTLGSASTQPASSAPKSIFGSGSSSFTFGSTPSDKPSSAPSSNIFGNSEVTSTGKDATKSPIHFGFGGSSTSTPTAFGVPRPSTESAASTTGENSVERESSDRATPATEGGGEGGGDNVATIALLSRNPHDEDGEGEESEETVHSIRSKIMRLADNKWTSLGVGILKLKKEKETGARRILARNSGTGKVMLNFRLYSGLKPTQDATNSKVLKFIGHEDGASQTYGVQVKTQEDSDALKNVFEREIAFVKAKEAE